MVEGGRGVCAEAVEEHECVALRAHWDEERRLSLIHSFIRSFIHSFKHDDLVHLIKTNLELWVLCFIRVRQSVNTKTRFLRI